MHAQYLEHRKCDHLYAYFYNWDQKILPFNFRVTHHVSQTFCEIVSREHSVTQLPRNGTEHDTVTWKINVRGIARVRRCAEHRTYDDAVFFRCSEHTAGVIGTRIYSRTRALTLAISCASFHFSCRTRDRSLFTSPGDLWKLIETCIHHRSIGKLSARRGTAYVSRK